MDISPAVALVVVLMVLLTSTVRHVPLAAFLTGAFVVYAWVGWP